MDGKLFFDTYQTAPPRYTTREAGPSTSTSGDQSTPPPYYLEEACFPVGGKVPKNAFVTAPQLKAHLGQLKAFRELKERVTDLEANQDVRRKLPSLAQELGPQDRWTWFLELALERYVLLNHGARLGFADLQLCRFHRWVSKLSVFLQPNGTLHNPPLDVWLIWHAYMLNPT